MIIQLAKCQWSHSKVKLSSVELTILNMNNFYTTAWPFLLILKIFGFFSVSFEGPVKEGIIKFKIFDKVNLAVKLLIAILFLLVDTNEPFSSNKPRLATLAWNVRVNCSLVLLLLSFLYQLINHESIIRLLHLLHKNEDQVKEKLDKSFIDFWIKQLCF